MNLPPLILASASPRRKELLRRLHPDFRVVSSNATEVHHAQLTAGELARVNAFRKARVVAKDFPDALVLGADTLVYLEGVLFGKPADMAEAKRMLQQLQGQTHQVYTGVCLIQSRAHWQKVFVEATDVRFKSLNPDQIDGYLASIDPLDKAGAYAIQEGGPSVIAEIAGSYSNVMGLPLERLGAELAAWERFISRAASFAGQRS